MLKSKKEKQMAKKYDYLIVGAGLYGAVFAQERKRPAKPVW